MRWPNAVPKSSSVLLGRIRPSQYSASWTGPVPPFGPHPMMNELTRALFRGSSPGNSGSLPFPFPIWCPEHPLRCLSRLKHSSNILACNSSYRFWSQKGRSLLVSFLAVLASKRHISHHRVSPLATHNLPLLVSVVRIKVNREGDWPTTNLQLSLFASLFTVPARPSQLP